MIFRSVGFIGLASGNRFCLSCADKIRSNAGMKVLMCPHYVINPYQRLLDQSLKELGWETGFVKSHATLGRQRSFDADVLHLHWQPEYRPEKRFWIEMIRWAYALSRAKLRGVKVIWTVHNAVPHESKNRFVDLIIGWMLFAVTDRSICHSDYAKRMAISIYGVEGDSISVVPHGNYVGVYPNTIDRDAARRLLGLDSSGRVMLFFGLIRAYKGVFDLIKAFKKAAPSIGQLVIAGKLHGVSEEEVRDVIGGDERIKLFAGRVEDEELQNFFNASDVVAFPYRRSLTSGAAILAMSYGKACMAYRHPGMQSILDDKGAVFADPRRETSLDEAVAKCFVDETDLDAAGTWNLNKSDHWNWENVGKLTDRVYRLKDERVI